MLRVVGYSCEDDDEPFVTARRCPYAVPHPYSAVEAFKAAMKLPAKIIWFSRSLSQ